jgi:bifunctional oligoribonuclease and PAP phosphatase NrnA
MSILDTFRSRIQGIKSVVLTTHVMPDADGIGSEVGLCLALRQMGIKAICVNSEPLPQRYRYMDPQNVIVDPQDFNLNEFGQVDLWIVVDTNTTDRVAAEIAPHIKKNGNVLFIDHHPTPHHEQWSQHCIDTSAAATGQLAGEIILGLGLKFTPEIALPLYTAIIIDTSSFRYPSVSAKTHRLVSQLLDTGITRPLLIMASMGPRKWSICIF